MHLILISPSFKRSDLSSLPVGSFREIYDGGNQWTGIIYEEQEHNWVAILKGSEVWYDEESRTIATIYPARQPQPVTVRRLLDVREEMGVPVRTSNETPRTGLAPLR